MFFHSLTYNFRWKERSKIYVMRSIWRIYATVWNDEWNFIIFVQEKWHNTQQKRCFSKKKNEYLILCYGVKEELIIYFWGIFQFITSGWAETIFRWVGNSKWKIFCYGKIERILKFLLYKIPKTWVGLCLPRTPPTQFGPPCITYQEKLVWLWFGISMAWADHICFRKVTWD